MFEKMMVSIVWAALVLAGMVSAVKAGGAVRPNVVVLLADDQGWGDLSLMGNRNLRTPRIDSLAASGVSFDRFYVCPVCSPTRAEFLTGRYHPRGGVFGVSTGGERLDLDEVTIANVFKAGGYATGAFGKWHNGTQYPYHPNARGFDEFYGFCSGHWGNYFSPMLDHNGEITHGEGYVADDFTDKALAFMGQQKQAGRPFFAYLAYCIPHSPMQVPDAYWSRFAGKTLIDRHRDPEKEEMNHTRAALAMCENLNWNVGRVLDRLDEWGIADNTIVVYFSDNGPNGWRWNGGMKGKKGSTDEGGVRVPFMIRWPGHLPAGRRIKPIAGAIDILPTLAELAGVNCAGTRPLDGRSLVPLLTEGGEDWPRRSIFSHWNNKVSVRTDRFRLDDRGNLYDMITDPSQKRVVNELYPQIRAKLMREVDQWRQEVLSDLDRSVRPFTVGHRDSRLDQLPARDGIATGQIKRSSIHPNCSYFTHWQSVDDRIYWPIEVLTSGRYEVTLYYTCSADAVGTVFEMSYGQERVRGVLKEWHDPQPKGAKQDRVVRTESYVKDFKPMRVGVLRLNQGRGELGLNVLKLAGEQAMDVRLVTLRRVR